MIDATNLERATTRVNAELLRYQRDEMEAADREEADGPGRLVTFDARAAGDAGDDAPDLHHLMRSAGRAIE